MRITCVIASTTLALTIAASITAQDRFETLPGYDRYKLVADSMNELVTGGRISRINWNDEHSRLEFVRDDMKYELDLKTLELSEQEVVEEGEDRPNARRRQHSSRATANGTVWFMRLIAIYSDDSQCTWDGEQPGAVLWNGDEQHQNCRDDCQRLPKINVAHNDHQYDQQGQANGCSSRKCKRETDGRQTCRQNGRHFPPRRHLSR